MTPQAVETLIGLQRLRSLGLVSQALAARFPGEDAWEAWLNEPDVRETISAVTDILLDMGKEVPDDVLNYDALLEATSRHYDRAIEALSFIAEDIGVETFHLLSVISDT